MLHTDVFIIEWWALVSNMAWVPLLLFEKGSRSQEASYTTSPKVSENIKSGVFFLKLFFKFLKRQAM